jgi:hypothetical protein
LLCYTATACQRQATLSLAYYPQGDVIWQFYGNLIVESNVLQT